MAVLPASPVELLIVRNSYFRFVLTFIVLPSIRIDVKNHPHIQILRAFDSKACFKNAGYEQRPKRDAILDAAYRQFSHYSFRKTWMEDIAQAAGISRASIYSYFQNKDDIFRNVSIQLHDQAEHMAGPVWKVATMTLPAASRALCYAPWPIPESRDRIYHGNGIR